MVSMRRRASSGSSRVCGPSSVSSLPLTSLSSNDSVKCSASRPAVRPIPNSLRIWLPIYVALKAARSCPFDTWMIFEE